MGEQVTVPEEKLLLDKSVTSEYVNAFTAFLREKRPNFGNQGAR